jgi:hypothetical protein
MSDMFLNNFLLIASFALRDKALSIIYSAYV